MSIRPEQFRTIHTLQRAMGLSDSDYRNMLWDNFGVRSSKDLITATRAEELIRVMRSKVGGSVYGQGKAKYEQLRARPGMATPAQLRMIEAMWADVSVHKDQVGRDKSLLDFLRRRFQLLSIFSIAKADVQRVVKALKAMKAQKEKGPDVACKHCGCTETTPCIMPDGTGCSWLPKKKDVCSACIRFESEAA